MDTNKKVLESAIKAFKDVCRKLILSTVQNIKYLLAVCQWVIFVCVLNLAGLDILLCVAISTLYLYMCCWILEFDRIYKGTTYDGMPLPHKQFTHEDSDGFIDVKETDIQEAIQYLNSVEKYLKNKGFSIDKHID